MPTSISKSSISRLSEHYGDLSEQCDVMINYIQELPSILGTDHQQVKKYDLQTTDKSHHPFPPGDWVYSKVFRR